VDRPLVVWKGTGGATSDVVVPHLNWRGLFGRGTNASGNPTGIEIEWPGFQTTAYHTMGPTQAETRTWMGSLLEGAAGRGWADVHAEPVLRSADGAVHAAGPDRDRGGAERVWVRGGGSGELFGSVWFVSATHLNSHSITVLAAVIVGLAARARLSDAGGGWRADTVAKSRLLKIDIIEQLRFLTRLPTPLLSDSAEYKILLERRVGTL
jgi:hypothetical protein